MPSSNSIMAPLMTEVSTYNLMPNVLLSDYKTME